jgi:hypothetical protein
MKLTGKPKYSGKNLSQCHFVYHKDHTNPSWIETGPRRLEPDSLHAHKANREPRLERLSTEKTSVTK